jgi:hypothetical protein
MRRFLIGVAIAVSLGGAGLAVAQDQTDDTTETGGAAGLCATPQASPEIIASPDDALVSTPEILDGTPVDCATPVSGTPAT